MAFVHGERKIDSATYSAWRSMTNNKHARVERWQGTDGFNNFKADMGERPPQRKLVRLDKSQPYGPDNCVWMHAVEWRLRYYITNRNTTGYSGIFYSPRGNRKPYKVAFTVRGKDRYIGSFDTLDEAVVARERGIQEILDEIHAKESK